jgi:hypothetical protein
MMHYRTCVALLLVLFSIDCSAEESPAIVSAEAKESDDRLVIARGLPPEEREAAIREIAIEHAKQRQPLEALRTLSYLSRPGELAKGLQEIRLLGMSDSHSENASSNGPRLSVAQESGGGQGGASLADYSSLMELIQTTVVPDTWEALGGPSTMSPYAAGIVVNGEGIVEDSPTKVNGSALDKMDLLLQSGEEDAAGPNSGIDAWRLKTPYRCVSLRRLSQEVIRRRISGEPIDDSMRNLAGLSRVQYIILDLDNKDIVLAGPVGGITLQGGWWQDRLSGDVTMRLDYFATAAGSILGNLPFGCTIDPTREALANAALVSNQVRTGEVPIGLAAESLRQAIGLQDVRVFGMAGDTPLAYLMVEADRHMKQLALGLQPVPVGASTYLDVVTRHLDRGPPDGQLLRLWFTGSPMAVRVDETGSTFELAGRPLKLISETRLAAADGGRIPTDADFRVTEFVDEFNARFDSIAMKYPIYGALQSVYRSAAVAELVRRSAAATWLPAILGPMLLDDPSQGQLRTPRKVESIATLHRAVHRGKRYSIVMASGGVHVEPRETVESTFRPYATLVSVRDRFVANETVWWWNAK